MKAPSKIYLTVPASGGHFNVDVYRPSHPAFFGDKHVAVFVVMGGDGWRLRSAAGAAGVAAAAYHDVAEMLSGLGVWVFVPSRRGDPQRTSDDAVALAPQFASRLPSALFEDLGPNTGRFTHVSQVEELHALLTHLRSGTLADFRAGRVGVLAISAGAGIAMRFVSEAKEAITTVAFWAASLKSSQWFKGPKAEIFFRGLLEKSSVAYDHSSFVAGICDPANELDALKLPLLFACGATDASEPAQEVDSWTTPREQVVMLSTALNARVGVTEIVKGAGHLMHRELVAWASYEAVITRWFKRTLLS